MLTGDQKTGYLHYTDFSAPSGEQRLAEVFQGFKQAGVEELVVDLRYNGGGYLFLASQLAYMVGGAEPRRARRSSRSASTTSAGPKTRRFPSSVFAWAMFGSGLPALGLKRVFVLATGDTCSASESFISALRGIDIGVVLIGANTCGKPYGFNQQNNCTLSYFALEFEGRNHKGEIFPATGITPTCSVADDLSHPLGHPGEAMLAAALTYPDRGMPGDIRADGAAGAGRRCRPWQRRAGAFAAALDQAAGSLTRPASELRSGASASSGCSSGRTGSGSELHSQNTRTGQRAQMRRSSLSKMVPIAVRLSGKMWSRPIVWMKRVRSHISITCGRGRWKYRSPPIARRCCSSTSHTSAPATSMKFMLLAITSRCFGAWALRAAHAACRPHAAWRRSTPSPPCAAA